VLSELRMSHPAISVVVMSAEQDHDTVVNIQSKLLARCFQQNTQASQSTGSQ
jgi:hypothetical protein